MLACRAHVHIGRLHQLSTGSASASWHRTACAPRLRVLTQESADRQQQHPMQLLGCACAATGWPASEALLVAAPGSTALAEVQALDEPEGTWKYCPGRSAGAKRARWTTMPRELPLSDSAPPRMGCCTMRPRAISSCACVWTVRDSGTTPTLGSAETAELSGV